MPEKEIQIKEGGPIMDPAGKDFQAMLAAAQTAAVEKLATKPDVSMVEEKDEKTEKVVKPPVSSTASKEKVEEEPDETDEIPGDDIGNLKRKVSGLQSELTRVRKQKTGSADEVSALKERLANTEGQLKVLTDNKTTNTIEDKLLKLTDDQVADNKVAWEDELADARVTAHLAAKDNDPEAIKEANQRIDGARKMLKAYGIEERRRISEHANSRSTEKEERETMATEVDTLFTDLYTVAPDLNDKDSELWKAGQKEFKALPKLMKALGPLGELVAAASAIAKNPHLIGKKVISTETGKVLDTIEQAADKAFRKGGAAPTNTNFKPVTTINSPAELSSFEEMVRKVKAG